MAQQTTMSEATGTTDTPAPSTTIGDDLDATAARVPERDALVEVTTGRRWAYAELVADVDRLARSLLSAGVRTGDRVGIWAPSCAEWTLVQYATARIGVVLVTVNPAYRTHELAHVLRQAGIGTLVAAASFKTTDYPAMIDQVRADGGAPELERVVIIGQPSWDELVDDAERTSAEELARVAASLSPDDPINIQYTSGTTGFPKGATLSHRNTLGNGFFVGEGCAYTEEDIICIPVPFYHCFGMVMGNLAATSHGACMVIPAPGFDPAATLHAVQTERCTSLYGVLTMFTAMFGLIEKKVGTVGRVGPHLRIQIVDPVTRELVPRGTPGELCSAGYSVMLGYWEDPERTAEVLQDGWMSTGDIAVMDEDGFVEVTGRIKDLVIRGGENIYPREVEEFLHTHPDVVDVQVVGVPDERFAEPLTAEAVREFCTGRLAHYKIPRYVEVIDEFPMTVTGKVRKVELREQGEQLLQP